MSNVESNPGVGGAKFAVDNDGVQVWPYAKLAFGADGASRIVVEDLAGKRLPVKIGDALPAGTNVIGHVLVDGSVAVTGTFFQATQPVSGPQTDAEFAARLPLGVTGTFWPATQPISAVALPLPTGASTDALQTAGNASLTSIDSKIPASPSTSGKQDTGNASLASIDGKVPADPAREGGNLATLTAKDFATQTTLAALLAAIATAANQATEIASLATIASNTTLIASGSTPATLTGIPALGVVADTPQSYLNDEIRALSLTNEGRLRVSTVVADNDRVWLQTFDNPWPADSAWAEQGVW